MPLAYSIRPPARATRCRAPLATGVQIQQRPNPSAPSSIRAASKSSLLHQRRPPATHRATHLALIQKRPTPAAPPSRRGNQRVLHVKQTTTRWSSLGERSASGALSSAAAPGEGRPSEATQRGTRGGSEESGKRGDRTCATSSGLRRRRGSAAPVAHVGREAVLGESRLLALLAGRRGALQFHAFPSV
jgi:hypothetical protein